MSIARNFKSITETQEKNIRQQIVERWENFGKTVDAKTGKVLEEGINLLEGLTGQMKNNIALLYENQMKVLGESALNMSDNSGSYETVSLAMIRRIYANLLINEIASVQAATHPSVTMFYLLPQISDRVEGTDTEGRATSSHTTYIPYPACLGHNCPETTFSGCKSLYDRFYDDSLYDHSRGKYTIITATGTPVFIDRNGCTNPLTASTLPTGNDGSIRSLQFAVSGFMGSNPGTSKGHTARLGGFGGVGLEIDNQDFMASFMVIYAGATPLVDNQGNTILQQGDVVNYRMVANKYGKNMVEYYDFCDSDGNLIVELDFRTAIANCDTCPTFDGFTGLASGTTLSATDFAFAWKRYDDLEGASEVGHVTFTIEKVTHNVKPRKLNARWTPELARDVQAYHNIDAEQELTQIMSEQIAMEIDREALLMLKNGAAWKTIWNYDGWKLQGSQKYTLKEWNQTLVTTINQVSAQIHKATLRGGANFIVVSTEVAALLDDLENFAVSDAEAGQNTFNLGMRRAGTLGGRYKVFVDPYSRAGDILIGHKGTSILDTGFIYAPYVPLELSPVLQDTTNFTHVRQISTRYAMQMVNNRYYGYIRVLNIRTFATNELR